MQKLALITTSFPDGGSGQEAAGSFVADFAVELAKHVHVDVIAPSHKDSLSIEGNLHIHRFGVPHLPLSLLNPLYPNHWQSIAITLWRGQKAVNRLLRNNQIDHVLALWALPSGYWARRACKAAKVDYSIWALGSDIWTLGKIPVIRGILKHVLKDARNCFADGYVLAEDVQNISGLHCAFLPSTRHIALATDKKLAKKPPYRMAYLGRWHKNKGVDLLLDALGKLQADDWKQIEELRLFGGGPLHEYVHTRCREMAASELPVRIGGYLDKEDAAKLLQWADYLLLPSRIESIPVIFSDAVKSFTPIICTPTGDLPRLIAKYQTGILADAISAEAIAVAIRQALASSPQRFAAGVTKAASRFDLTNTAQALLDALDKDAMA